MASWKEHDEICNSRIVHLGVGQILASFTYLESRWKVSKPTVKRFIKLLEEDGMVSHYYTTFYGIITIVNYEKYQLKEEDENVQNVHKKTVQNVTKCVPSLIPLNDTLRPTLNDTLRPTLNEADTNRSFSTDNDTLADSSITLRDTLSSDDKTTLTDNNLLTPIRRNNISINNNINTKSEVSPKHEINYYQIVNLFHAHCPSFSKVLKVTDKRKTKIRLRMSEIGSSEKLCELFDKAEKSKFLRGDNNRCWKADFDWLMENSSNWVKVMEGKYDNQEDNLNRNKKSNEREIFSREKGRNESPIFGQMCDIANTMQKCSEKYRQGNLPEIIGFKE